jgi:hypothetical protein
MRSIGLFTALILSLAACGGSDDTGNSQSCTSTHECVNGVCECTTSSISGTSCTEATCEDECEVCTSS